MAMVQQGSGGSSVLAGKAEVDAEIAKYRKLEEDTNKLGSKRNKLYQQVNENGMVKAELERLKPDAPVYKLIGPVLIQQNLLEAKANVANRLRMIESGMEEVSKEVASKEEEKTKLADKIQNMQKEMQSKAYEEAQKVVEDARA